MLLVDGVLFKQCGNCHNWRLADEMRWDDERLDWVCDESNGSSVLVA